jgi:hypothetical protein
MARYDAERDVEGKFAETKDERYRQVNVRYTASEYAELESDATACGMTVSTYVRHRTLGRRVVSRVDQQMIGLLNKIGGLQKHWFNEIGTHPAQTAAILAEIHGTISEIHSQAIARRGRDADAGGEG